MGASQPRHVTKARSQPGIPRIRYGTSSQRRITGSHQYLAGETAQYMMASESFLQILEKAFQARADLLDVEHESAFRLFNGFSEGYPDLTLDVYGRTFVLHNYSDHAAQ